MATKRAGEEALLKRLPRMRGGTLAGIARTLVRMKAEDAKPSAERPRPEEAR